MYSCKYCKKEFEKRHSLAAHVSHCKLNPNYNDKRNNITGLLQCNKKQPRYIYEFNCIKCNNTYKLELTESEYNNSHYKKHCSRKCANTHIISDETKRKISNSLCPNPNIIICKVCGKEFTKYKNKSKIFCSNECSIEYFANTKKYLNDNTINKLSLAGRKSSKIQSINRRSKNEKYFCELCEKHFQNVEHNNPIFNGWDADIIIHDIKYAILWNGPWHYRQLNKKHSVEQVQNRDNIKINEIIKYGYIPYIIKDDGKFNEKFVKEKFDEFISLLN